MSEDSNNTREELLSESFDNTNLNNMLCCVCLEVCNDIIVLGSTTVNNSTVCSSTCCKECLITYIEMQINNGTRSLMNCPCSCGRQLTHKLINDIVGTNTFEKFDYRCLENGVIGMNISYCPNGCVNQFYDWEDSSDLYPPTWQCPCCNINICCKCKLPPHGRKKCKKRPVKSSSSLNNNEDNNNKSMKLIMKQSKPCPQCRINIFKSEGCNRVIDVNVNFAINV